MLEVIKRAFPEETKEIQSVDQKENPKVLNADQGMENKAKVQIRDFAEGKIVKIGEKTRNLVIKEMENKKQSYNMSH